jgi:hypothetical protein
VEFANTLAEVGSIPTKPPDIVNGFESSSGQERVSFKDKVLSIQTPPSMRERVNLIDNNLVRIECRTCAASRQKHPLSKCIIYLSIWQIWGDEEFLSFISEKIEWESLPSILVTRNLNSLRNRVRELIA